MEGVRTIAPASAEACGALLRECVDGGAAVVPRGHGTKLDWGNPVQADVVLVTRGMAGVREHSPGDLTVVVGAGTTWAMMQAVLAKHGQRVALDPLWPERATVGGIVAVNDSGALRGRYGSLRDLVIGLTVVLADGTVARSGGKVVKNVAGYDLHKLMIGAYGTLGVITEVVFRLHPMVVGKSWTVRVRAEEVNTALTRVREAPLSVEALQVRYRAGVYAMDVRCAALPDGLVGEPADGEVWKARERVFARQVVVKVTVPLARVSEILTWVREGAEAVAQGGIVTVGLDSGEDVAALRARVEGNGGALVVVRGEAGVNRWGTVPSTMELMREVKRLFDPTRTLNPGRYVGGI